MAKRTFSVIRKKILNNIAASQKTLNQIATETGINWKTVDNHATYLIGRGLAQPVFFSSYVKIITITEEGREFLRRTKK